MGRIVTSEITREQRTANARLIAAAPDAHDIALWALKVCEALDNTDLNHITMDKSGAYLRDSILAYLAKVEGSNGRA